MAHYVNQIRGRSGNSSLGLNSMIVNGRDNSIGASAENSLIAGRGNSVSTERSIVLGSFGSCSDNASIILSASMQGNTFSSRGNETIAFRAPGSLTTSGLTAPTSNNLYAGNLASGVISIVGSVTPGDTITVTVPSVTSFVFTANNGARTPGANDFDATLATPALIAADLLAALQDVLNAAVSANFQAVAGPASHQVTLKYGVPGVAGNLITVATTSAGITVPANLAGGTDGSTYKSFYVQGNDVADVNDTNYFSLVEYNRWKDEVTTISTNQQKVLAPNYIPQKSANWTNLSIIDSTLNQAPNNVAAALDILAKGLVLSQPAANLFEHTLSGGGDLSGLVKYNSAAPQMNGTEDFMIGAGAWNTQHVGFAGVATSKYSLVVGYASGSQLNYNSIGTGVLNVGLENTASGDHSVALGQSNSVLSTHSAVIGKSNSISSGSANSMVFGQELSVTGTSTGAVMLGGAAGVANEISNSIGSHLHVDGFSSRDDVAITSQNYVHKSVFFNGFSRGSGLANVDATDAAAALSDTVTDEGAREIFRPLHFEAIASAANATATDVFAVASGHYVTMHGYIMVAGSGEQVLFKLDEFLCDNTSVLNEATIAKLYDVSGAWSPFDITISLVSNKINIDILNSGAAAVDINAVLYFHDIFV